MKHRLTLAAILFAIVIFVVDFLENSGIAVAVLYVVPVLAAGKAGRSKETLWIALVCSLLTLLACVSELLRESPALAVVANDAIALAAIWATALFYSRKVTSLDTTERQQLQEAQTVARSELEKDAAQRTIELRETQNRLDYALRGANVGLWDWNAQTNEVFYSETARTQLGYPPDDPWKDFNDWESRLHPDDHDEAVRIVEKYFAERPRDYKSTFRLRCKDGSYRWILSLGVGTFNEDGLPLRLIGVHVDITERIEAENELRRLNEALADANEALRQSNVDLQQFAYVASHDLQTPLRAMSGYANLLQNDYRSKLDQQAVHYLERIVYGADRMKQLINDLLAYSRIESRAAPFEPVDLSCCLEDAIGLLDAAIDSSGAVITHDDLPTVSADASQLTQLFQNLLSNSIKYQSEETPKIHIRSQLEDEQWTISVRDNGIGFDSRHNDRIFEIFKRLHTQDEIPGTGIGLAVCRRIVNRHSGSIWVDSEVGKGSEFFFTIPAEQTLDGSPDTDNNHA